MTGSIATERENRHGLLDIEQAVVTGTGHEHADFVRGSLHTNAGDLVLVHVINLHQAEIWADLAVGLRQPIEGRVSILGNDLADLDREYGNWLRGRVGRAFSRGNWMDRLSLMDNILLPARHHSMRSDSDLRRQASVLAESFGMPGIPLGMPGQFTRIDLQRAACVRAFLGDPMMVLLEDPTYASHRELLSPLMGAIRVARNRGAAIIWFSPSADIWRDRTIPTTRRYSMAGSELMEVTGR